MSHLTERGTDSLSDVRGIPFMKLEAVGNDFVLLEEDHVPITPLPELARAICRRQVGVGSDGLLVIGPSDRADLRVRMFNPDGTEDHCGNGIRCAARVAAQPVLEGEERRLTMETVAGILTARLFHQDGRLLIETGMGEPRFHPRDLPMSINSDRAVQYPLSALGETIRLTVVSTGTTHAVLFPDDSNEAANEAPPDERFRSLSAAIECHPVFPERTSVLWATVVDEDRIRLRIWERGVGETLGCGTGACAAMVAARVLGRVGDEVTVDSAGGSLHAVWPGEGQVFLTGAARIVFQGVWTGSRKSQEARGMRDEAQSDA